MESGCICLRFLRFGVDSGCGLGGFDDLGLMSLVVVVSSAIWRGGWLCLFAIVLGLGVELGCDI